MVKPVDADAASAPRQLVVCRTGSRNCAGWRRGSESDREQDQTELAAGQQNTMRAPNAAVRCWEQLRTHGAGRSIPRLTGTGRSSRATTLPKSPLPSGRWHRRADYGRKLVVVQRTDLDLDSPAARTSAIADSRTSEVGLSWDGNRHRSGSTWLHAPRTDLRCEADLRNL